MSTPLEPPAIPQFPAGYGPLPADFTGWVTDSFGFLTSRIVFRAEMHTSQTINGFTTINFDTILEDPYSGWNATGFYWTAPYTGWYEVTLNYTVQLTTNFLEAAVLITGATRYELTEMGTNVNTLGGTGASLLVALVGGLDYVQGQAWSNAAASTDVTEPGRYGFMEITFISQ